MKVLIVNTSESGGGAAIAARRLKESLRAKGEEARMMVLNRSVKPSDTVGIGTSATRKLKFAAERAEIWVRNLFSRRNLFTVSTARTGFDITASEAFREADIVHLHWTNQGMLSLRSLERIFKSGKPVVLTLHDMWYCTGICHHARTCEGFRHSCGRCPLLRFPKENDLSRRIFLRKQTIYREAARAHCLHAVCVSRWLARQVESSSLLKGIPVSVIPNTLSLDDFRIFPRDESRLLLGLPLHKKIILFGAARIDDPIKGFDILLRALNLLLDEGRFSQDDLHLVLFGQVKHPENVWPLIPVDYTDMGWIGRPEQLSRLYSAADATISASHYETFGQTLIEAQACGCLPVTFGNSGQADIVRHKENGYVARYLSHESLADGMEWAVTEGQQTVSREALRHEVTGKYSNTTVAEQYIRLYHKILQEHDNK